MSHVKVTPSGLVTESQRLAASKLGGDIEYDAAGRVIADASRGITSIEYNSDSHPTKIKFSGGNTQALLWDNMGNHISTTYMTLNSSLVLSNQSVDELNVTGKPYYFTESKRRYYGSGQIAVDDSLVMTRFPGGYLTGDGKARYYFTDYQGNNLATVDANGKIVESTGYYPYGLPWDEPTENSYLYGDKEYDNVHGLGEYYYGARQSVPVLAGGFTTIDPLCEKRPGESPYILCGANPIRNVDPDGSDWYQNKETLFYTWFDSNEEMEGYDYIGKKGSILGEAEKYVDEVIRGNNWATGLYENGFTFDIPEDDKGALIGSQKRGWDFLDEFLSGDGPDYSIMLDSHPYTKELMNEQSVVESQEKIQSGDTKIPGQRTDVGRKFGIWDYLTTFSLAKQFIGSYRYDGYSTSDNNYIINIVSD